MLRSEYTISLWRRILYGFCGLLFLAGAIACAAVVMNGAQSAVLALFGILAAAGGVYMLALPVRGRMVLEGTRIEVRDTFREHVADLSEIEGFRTISSRNGRYWKIYLKDGRGSFSIADHFNTDDNFRVWFQQVVDLDLRDGEITMAEIAHDETVGATEQERMDALARAKRWAIGLNVIATVAAVCAYVTHGDAKPIAVLVSIIAPFSGAALVWWKPRLYSMFKPKKDPRADLAWVSFAPTFGLCFASSDFHPVAITSLLPAMGALALAYAFVSVSDVRRGRSVLGNGLVLLLISCGFAYGAAATANATFDDATPGSYSTQVLGKHVSRGRSTSYYVRLAPWGPVQGERDLHVSYGFYRDARINGTVCLRLHPGALHAPWYAPVSCTAPTATGY